MSKGNRYSFRAAPGLTKAISKYLEEHPDLDESKLCRVAVAFYILDQNKDSDSKMYSALETALKEGKSMDYVRGLVDGYLSYAALHNLSEE